MKRKISYFIGIILVFCLGLTAIAQKAKKAEILDALKQTSVPPKGWNSWDSYGMYPTQKAMIANLEVMAKRLKPFGYEFFVIDAGWNKVKDEKGKIVGMSLDNSSRYIPNKATFPGGLKAVADKAHSLGLKFGIHIMRGISRIAYKENMPIYGTKFTAKDIADTTSICKWNSDNYGVDMRKPGAQEYYDSYIMQLIGWGVDFLKADDITGFPKEIEAVIKAIKKTNKNVILSLSPGGDAKTEFFETYKKADMLRVTKDVWDDQVGIDRVFTAWKLWKNVDHTGFWLDMDMIPFGHLCLQHPDLNFLSAKQDESKKGERQSEHVSFFTDDQKYSFMAMRALSASPLFIGGDLPTTDELSFKLLTNKEMIACNENGMVGNLVSEKNSMEIWKVVKKNNPKKGWLGVFNRTKQKQSIELSGSVFGIDSKAFSLFNIWDDKTIGKMTSDSKKSTEINGGGVLFCSYNIK
jgi:alpha-galactosidase